MNTITFRTDVSAATGLPPGTCTVSSILLPSPDRMADPTVVVFAFPGGGYGRGYYTFDMPGSDTGGQAGYHAANHGVVFVACDLPGVGDSLVADPGNLTWEQIEAATEAMVEAVMRHLRAGTLAEGFPAVSNPVTIGMGQSMGGCFTIATQGRRGLFDAVAILGFSAIHTRGSGDVMSEEQPGAPLPHLSMDEHIAMVRRLSASPDFGKGFHWPDVPEDIVRADLSDYPVRHGNMPEWGSATMPGCALTMLTPGVVSDEASAIEVPVFVAAGELDLIPDPHAEPSAYARSTDVTVFVVPRMAHMHNFGGTRFRLWERLGAWFRGVNTQPMRRPIWDNQGCERVVIRMQIEH